MTPRVRTAACLIACAVVALVGAADVAAAERRPAPEGLWQMYPLDQTGGGQRSRPTGAQQTPTTETEPPATQPRTAPAQTAPPPTSGVAGTSATITATADAADGASGDGGSSLTVALVLGLFAASIVLLALAALPQNAVPVLGERVSRHRTDLTIAAALSLLALAVVFLAGGF